MRCPDSADHEHRPNAFGHQVSVSARRWRLLLMDRFFEWDASLVRDGTYYAAMLLAKNNGSDDDIACCVQAINELRWAHAKAWSRSAE